MRLDFCTGRIGGARKVTDSSKCKSRDPDDEDII